MVGLPKRAERRVRKPLLYPLSYEGASAQSSDLRVDPCWQGVTRVDLGQPGGSDWATSTRRPHTPGRPMIVEPGWHRLEEVSTPVLKVQHHPLRLLLADLLGNLAPGPCHHGPVQEFTQPRIRPPLMPPGSSS